MHRSVPACRMFSRLFWALWIGLTNTLIRATGGYVIRCTGQCVLGRTTANGENMARLAPTTKERLERSCGALEMLECIREIKGDRDLGKTAERLIVDRELRRLMVDTAIDETNQEIGRQIGMDWKRDGDQAS